jgi:DNA polymerase elongation subunit (family B)
MEIWTLDIETSPHKSHHWRVWQENIAPGQMIEATRILTFAAKKLGSNKVIYKTYEDADFLSVLHGVLESADIVVGYNLDKFDIRHINREFVQAGIAPPRPYATIDLLKVVKKNFLFPHNRLDYVCSVLLDERKLETGGFDLWVDFMAGCPKAYRVMKKYNIRDTRLTEKLYQFLRPWIKNHPHVGFAVGPDDFNHLYECPACGSEKTIAAPGNLRRTRCYSIRQVFCGDCYHWFDGKRRKMS